MQHLYEQYPFAKDFRFVLRDRQLHYVSMDLTSKLGVQLDFWLDFPTHYFNMRLQVRMGSRRPDVEV